MKIGCAKIGTAYLRIIPEQVYFSFTPVVVYSLPFQMMITCPSRIILRGAFPWPFTVFTPVPVLTKLWNTITSFAGIVNV